MENIGKIPKQSLFPVKLCPIVLLGFPTEVASQKSANAIKTNYNMVDWWPTNAIAMVGPLIDCYQLHLFFLAFYFGFGAN